MKDIWYNFPDSAVQLKNTSDDRVISLIFILLFFSNSKNL